MARNRRTRLFYGYIVVAALFCIILVSWGIFFSFGVFFAPMLAEFGWTRAATSGAFSLAFIVNGVLGIGVGRLTDKFGPRLVMSGCGLFLGLGLMLVSLVSATWQLYLVYGIIIGSGMSATFVPACSVIARWFVKRRGMMTGIVLSGVGVGTIIMPHIARWLISTYGWRVSYIIVGIIALVLIMLAAQFLRRDPAQVGQLAYGANEVREASSHLVAHEFSLREAMRIKQFWLLCGISFCVWFLPALIMAHIVIHAIGQGLTAASAIAILTAIGAASIFGRLIMGSSADRIGTKPALVISFGITFVSFVLLIIAQEAWMLYLFGFIFGFAFGGLSPLISPTAAQLFGLGSLGVILGVAVFVGMIGEAAGIVLSGWIFDVTGSYQWAFMLCAAIGLSGVILSLLLKPANGLLPAPARL